MTRRELFRRGALSLGALAVPLGAGRAQRPAAPPRDSAASDRLYDPSMVQPRARATGLDNDAEVKAIEQRLKCTCGCNLDIYTCRTTDFTCTYSPQLHREVLELREAGKSGDEIVAAFVAKYGEQVLMAPKPEGFNLAGYLVPGALLLLAGALLAWVLMRRSRATMASPLPALVKPGALATMEAAEQERLRQALAEVDD